MITLIIFFCVFSVGAPRLESKRIFTSMMNEILMRALNIMRQLTMGIF
jgi:hypothetical protein